MSFNKVIMAGRLVRDPEKKISQDGKTFATFTIAVDRNYKSEETDFFDCVAFGNTADYLLSYVRKGYMVLVEGNLQIDKWTDRDGVNHSKPKIIANVIRNFEKRKDDYHESSNKAYNEVMGKEDKIQEEEQLDISEFEDDKLFDDLEDLSDDDFPLRY